MRQNAIFFVKFWLFIWFKRLPKLSEDIISVSGWFLAEICLHSSLRICFCIVRPYCLKLRSSFLNRLQFFRFLRTLSFKAAILFIYLFHQKKTWITLLWILFKCAKSCRHESLKWSKSQKNCPQVEKETPVS